jgi:hypothetical protein
LPTSGTNPEPTMLRSTRRRQPQEYQVSVDDVFDNLTAWAMYSYAPDDDPHDAASAWLRHFAAHWRDKGHVGVAAFASPEFA